MATPIHIAVGTPMYSGLASSAFQRSVMGLAKSLARGGDKLSTIFLGNESLIGRARNAIAWHFLQSDATHLLFCDADIGFDMPDIARMVGAQKPILVAPCPLKAINWERVHEAALAGHGPDELSRFSGLFNIVHLPGSRIERADRPFEIKWGGTGLMLIERSVLEELQFVTETYANRCPGDAMPPGVIVHNFFPSYVKDGDLLSEDYGFCEVWRGIGGKVWAAPWVRVRHMGTYAFQGSYRDIFAGVPGEALKTSPESGDRKAIEVEGVGTEGIQA